ncbi:hypothetical protein ASG17_13775 [Brevundimonas sp. Leaf363]|uniref:baseplate multidomain protein megatron n=1 Tax=Brevundimonas sp. Leaf363 TaxID=1736353 RepID=UPI0006F8B7B5|nr:glycoside hydrolase/phage tail family protein [Brevundimonas sp. Leaf363]KQS54014.1 hypothetical protein ASG17_13775 [Brevundimonas sp. Leaf363]
MAQIILGGVGAALGGGFGRAAGAALGRVVDSGLVAGLAAPRQVGPRLEGLRIQSSAEGAPMACAFGRARVTGQVIWAARFLESRRENGGGKGGRRTVDYSYSLSFAVALCEGPINGVGRVWADGQLMDLTGVTMRVHRGTVDQAPDPLIEAVEGAAPAYRGVSYVVFEDLVLDAFGDRPPQLSFEVFHRPEGDRLEERLTGVCLIPGAGEFVLATEAVLRRDGLTQVATENVHGGDGRPDLVVSLDQLQAQCPNLRRVSLVVGWFGDDLRAGECSIRPGVENRDKRTEPMGWSAAGLGREEAHLISEVGGGPAYGGTPSDESVRQAVADLKARGLEVTLYPFVFMDAPGYPWRGRITGRDGVNAAADVAAFFGDVDGWGLRRLARHYAVLAAETGADGLLIGSELRGLTWTRDASGGHPAVAQLRALAAECRAIAPCVALSYAADWSEYFGHQPGDGTVTFHLDPLWADANIDYVGIDWYAPLTDWRDSDGGVDAALYEGPADPAYLAAGVAGGEGFDWFYASDADRAAQVRTPIVDTAHGEDWVFRPKDLAGWWSNAHHDRPGGVRSGAPTAWVPGMKPIRLTEFGCAAVDRGGNAPNLFQDPKSSESSLPPFSTGARDDAVQRAAVEAVLAHWDSSANNPVSSVYGGTMMQAADVWCWDARPFPAFPARSDLWADAGAWRCGHWLNGRMTGSAADLVRAMLRRGGLADDAFAVEGVDGAVAGYVIDRPMATRDALEPLLTALDAGASEAGGRVTIRGGRRTDLAISPEALALPDGGVAASEDRRLEAAPAGAWVRFIDAARDYQTGAAGVRSAGEGAVIDLDLPVVCETGQAETVAARLAAAGGAADRTDLALDPLLALRIEAGDLATIDGRGGLWRVDRVQMDETPTARLRRLAVVAASDAAPDWSLGDAPVVTAAPFVRLLDLPPLPGSDGDARPVAAVAVEPWVPMTVHAGGGVDGLSARGAVEAPATVGVLTEALAPGVRGRWDRANTLTVRVEGRAPESAAEAAVLGGRNVLAVETAAGWEMVQFRQAELVGGGVWRLSGLLRAQQGTDAQAAAGAGTGAVVVLLDAAPARVSVGAGERNLPLTVRVAPRGTPAGGPLATTLDFTWTGVAERPWAPAHLRAEVGEDGARIGWVVRDRLSDGWDGEATPADPLRFRVRVLDDGAVVRTFEATATTALYAAADLAADLPSGLGGVEIGVAQWSEVFGWGSEAQVAL